MTTKIKMKTIKVTKKYKAMVQEEYYSVEEAEAIIRERGVLSELTKQLLRLPDGDGRAVRVEKGGQWDKSQVLPWAITW